MTCATVCTHVVRAHVVRAPHMHTGQKARPAPCTMLRAVACTTADRGQTTGAHEHAHAAMPQVLSPWASASASGVAEACDPAAVYLRRLLGAGALLLACLAHSLTEVASRTRDLDTLTSIKVQLMERMQRAHPDSWLVLPPKGMRALAGDHGVYRVLYQRTVSFRQPWRVLWPSAAACAGSVLPCCSVLQVPQPSSST